MVCIYFPRYEQKDTPRDTPLNRLFVPYFLKCCFSYFSDSFNLSIGNHQKLLNYNLIYGKSIRGRSIRQYLQYMIKSH